MIGAVITLSIVSLGLLIACGVLAKVSFSLYGYQREFEEAVEERVDETLRVLDACYMDIAVVASRPVFFDSPEVRSVVASVQRARDAVLHVAEVFEDAIIEDNTSAVEPKDVPSVGSEPAPEPERGGTPEPSREQRRRALRNAVVSGQMQVLDPIGSHSQPGTDGGLRVDQYRQPDARLQAALNRHTGIR